MSALTPFNYGSLSVRVVERDGEAWFVAADVCAALEIANPSDAVSKLDDDEKSTLGNSEGRAGHGPQSFNIISEAGLYALILRSRKPEARRFSRWVRHEVLPAIRRTGRYGVAETSVSEKLKLLSAAERLGGKVAARALWPSLGLPPLLSEPGGDLPTRIMRCVPTAIPISRRALHRSVFPRLPAVVFDSAVSGLVDAGRLAVIPTEPGRPGRPSVSYIRREG